MSKKVYKKKDVTALVLQKLHISNAADDSIPAFGTKKTGNSTGITHSFKDFSKLCQQTVPQKPYNKAKLVHHNYDLTKRWYVEFWAWNDTTKQKERVRLFKPLNYKKHNVTKRLDLAEQMIRIINSQLEAGKVKGKDAINTIVADHPGRLTLLNAITYVAKQKELNGHRKNYYRTFNTLHTNLSNWLEFKKHPDFPLKEFDRSDATEFFKWMRDESEVSNKTINNTMLNLRTAFNYIEKQGDKVFKTDHPLAHLPVLPVVTKMHAAYSDAQIEKVFAQIKVSEAKAAKHRKPGYKQLQLFISFIYYLLARPNEIIQLRVGDIRLSDNRVLIKGEVSKTKVDFYVEISPKLKTIIQKSGVLKYPEECYIFGKEGVPGTAKVHANFFWDKHNRILKLTGLLALNPHFSLYSYKHSGVVSLYKATKDIKLVQRQCRHQTLEQTNTYLRDLGLLSEYDQLSKWKGAV